MDMSVNIAGVEWKNPVTDGSPEPWFQRQNLSDYVDIK